MASVEPVNTETHSAETVHGFAHRMQQARSSGNYGKRANLLMTAVLDGRIARWIREGNRVYSDPRGIKFEIGPITDHLPYHKITPEVLEALEKQALLDDVQMGMVRERISPTNADTTVLDDALVTELRDHGIVSEHTSARDQIAHALLEFPADAASVLASGAPLSLQTIRYALFDFSSSLSLSERALRLFHIVERVAAHVARDSYDDPTPQPSQLYGALAFDAIESKIRTPDYAPVSRLLTVLLSADILPQLTSSGILVSRGQFRKGAEGLLIAHRDFLAAIYFDPSKDLGKNRAPYDALEITDRQEFLSALKLLRPYHSTRLMAAHLRKKIFPLLSQQLPREDTARVLSELVSTLRGIENFVGFAVPSMFTELHRIIAPIADGTIPSPEQITRVDTLLTQIIESYRASIDAPSIRDLLAKALPEAERLYVNLGSEYLDSMPPSVRDPHDENGPKRWDPIIASLLIARPQTIPVSHIGASRIPPLALIEKTLSAIAVKIKIVDGVNSGHPTIGFETGSAHIRDQQVLSAVETAAAICVRVSDAHQCNIMTADNQCGAGALLERELLRMQALAESEHREFGAHAFCIVPGKTTYIPHFPLFWSETLDNALPDGVKEPVYAGSPVATVALHQSAGYRDHTIDTDYALPSKIERLFLSTAGKSKRITVATNGGAFLLKKLVMDLELPGQIVFVRGTGRLTDLMCAVLDQALVRTGDQTVNIWEHLDPTEIRRLAASCIDSIPAQSSRAQAQKDLETELAQEQIVHFIKGLHPADVAKIHVVGTDELEPLLKSLAS